ncbi:MAG: trypsin-like peptidase domain-containing protein [Candidatus Promineifilaceae bacterium]
MVNLETTDRQQLILLLQDVSLMQTESERRQLLEFAGLQQVIPLIRLDGAPFVATSTMVNDLAKFGEISYGNEALGVFLNTVKTFTGVDKQPAIDGLLVKYDMMDPTAPIEDVDDWKAPDTSETVLEKIFGENTLRPIAFLAHGLEVAKSVALVRVDTLSERWTGTAFLVAPNLAITNHHVVQDKNLLRDVELVFNYQDDFAGQPQAIEKYKAKPTGLFHANKGLDYAILELEQEAGVSWGHLPLSTREVEKGQRINIIQHPYGQPKQISFQNNLVEYVDANLLQYVTSTDPGASGSPVLNDRWEVVGIHHAGGRLQEPQTHRYYNRNEGIRIGRILEDLPASIRQQIDNV